MIYWINLFNRPIQNIYTKSNSVINNFIFWSTLDSRIPCILVCWNMHCTHELSNILVNKYLYSHHYFTTGDIRVHKSFNKETCLKFISQGHAHLSHSFIIDAFSPKTQDGQEWLRNRWATRHTLYVDLLMYGTWSHYWLL